MPKRAIDSITTFSVLTPEECDRVLAEIKNLQPHWIRRSLTAALYSLGLATYLDSGIDMDPAAKQLIQDNNDLLSLRFAWLYEKIHFTLQDILGARIKHAHHLPRPGFHIFVYQPFAFDKRLGPHYDQYSMHSPDIGRMTITLPITLPSSPSGLNLWNRHFSRDPKPRMDELEEPEFLPYRQGEAVVHSGMWLHEVNLGETWKPDDMRVTLQGHLYQEVDETWTLYW